MAEFMHNPLLYSTADATTSELLQECAATFVNAPPTDGFVLIEYFFTESIKVAKNMEGSLLQLFTTKASEIRLSVGGRVSNLIPKYLESMGKSQICEYTDAFIEDFV